MPPAKVDFDLTDRGWVDLYVKKCESIMKEFTNYVYALQSHCVKERVRSEQLNKDCKRLQTIVKKFTEEKRQPLERNYYKCDIDAKNDFVNLNNKSLGIVTTKTPKEFDADRTAISDGSPAFLNMAMDSEQLQIDTSCALSPAQHRQEIIMATEQLSSPTRLSIPIDSIFQHNTSPTCNFTNNNENKSALGFLKARGRVGKVFQNESWEHKLREHNCVADEEDTDCGVWKNKGKLQAKRSDWLGKDMKSAERRISVKRASTVMDHIQRKRGILSLNKSGERKLKQSRLTQMVGKKANKVQNETTSTTSAYAAEAQELSLSPTAPAITNIKKNLDFPSFPNDTADIFHFSSDDEDYPNIRKSVKANTAVNTNARKLVDATYVQLMPHETEKSESVLAITPTAPPLICLDESDDNEQRSAKKAQLEKNERAANSRGESRNIKVKREKSTTEKLPTHLAAAMLAEWEEDDEEDPADDKSDVKLNLPSTTVKCQTTPDFKPRLSQLPAGKISIKECFNIDCDECQKYIDFMGSNMTITEIETHLSRCTRHRVPKDCIPVTPPDYWNPLMPSFSESDPRNKTLLVDPCLQRNRFVD